MINRKMYLTALVLLGILLAACSATPSPTEMMQKPLETQAMSAAQPTEAMMSDHSMPTADTAMMEETPDAMAGDEQGDMTGDMKASDASMDQNQAAMMETPTFFQTPLTDAITGQDFAIQDFSGKVVLVETLAMWCPNCLKQQVQVKALHDLLGMRDDLVSLGLDVDPNEKIDDLRNYVTGNGFDWKYAVAPAEVAREIGALYGDQFLNPTSTPMFIVDQHGQVHPLPFGIKSAEDLQKALELILNEQM